MLGTPIECATTHLTRPRPPRSARRGIRSVMVPRLLLAAAASHLQRHPAPHLVRIVPHRPEGGPAKSRKAPNPFFSATLRRPLSPQP